MLYKKQKTIKNVGVITYEIFKNNKYGIILTDTFFKNVKISDAFETYREAFDFLNILMENDVTLTTLKYIFEDYQYEKYLKIIKNMVNNE